MVVVLPAPLGAEESVDLLPQDGEGDAVDGLDVVEALAEVRGYEEVFCQGAIPISSVGFVGAAGGSQAPGGIVLGIGGWGGAGPAGVWRTVGAFRESPLRGRRFWLCGRANLADEGKLEVKFRELELFGR